MRMLIGAGDFFKRLFDLSNLTNERLKMNPKHDDTYKRKKKPLTPEELQELTDTVIILNQINNS